MLTHILKTIRYDEWGSTKLFETVLVLVLGWQIPTSKSSLLGFLYSFGFVGSYLALGYLLNDISDFAYDKKVGKYRGVHNLTKSSLIILVFILTLINILSLILMQPYQTVIFSIGISLSYFALLGYSFPPVRLKERGLLGAFTAALAQRALPALVVVALLDEIPLVVIVYLALLTFHGLRWILIHQFSDTENDRKSGIHTFSTDQSMLLIRRLMRYLFFPLEIFTGLILTLLVFDMGKPYFWILILYWSLMPVYNIIWHRKIEPISLFSYNFVPGSNFLFYIFPITLLLRYAFTSLAGWAILLVVVVVKWRYLCWQTANFFDLIRIFYRTELVAGEKKQAKKLLIERICNDEYDAKSQNEH